VPERPQLRHVPALVACRINHVDVTDATCVLIEIEDWQRIREWYLTLERELKAACLASGGTPSKCRTSE
jgi:hypothetical protein